ncbi:MAG: hypothetical protein OHK0039_06420 [Bacteroidia bacterium]
MTVPRLSGLLLAVLLPLAVFAQQRGELVSVTPLPLLNTAAIQNYYAAYGIPTALIPIQYEVQPYRVVYRTPAGTGDSLTVASGLVLVPQYVCDLPIYNYNHGTIFYGEEPSLLRSDWIVGLIAATSGYLGVLPDYLGFGATPAAHPHLYIHANTSASAVVDMLRASRLLCAQEDIALNGQVFLAGYSQGGFVTMAAAREIETNHSDEFDLTAVLPASGPYDVSGVTFQHMLAEKPTSSFYLGFVLMSYQYLYGLWSDPSEVFVPPYDVVVPAFFDRSNPQPASLPDTAVRMLRPDLVAAVLSDSLHPFRQFLRLNDVYDWAPASLMRMYYCEADEQVPYQNALIAYDQFVANGSNSTIALSGGANLDHGGCATPVLLFGKLWFDGLRAACDTTVNDTTTLALGGHLTLAVQAYPNPFRDRLDLRGLDQPADLSLIDAAGRRIWQGTATPGTATIGLPAALPAGLYTLRVVGRQGTALLRLRRE